MIFNKWIFKKQKGTNMVSQKKSRVLEEEQEPAVERNSLETQAYERIKKAILCKELKPGEKVSHTEWADRLNFSRTPVRDALKRLEFEGFIIRENERQWHVYTLTIDEVYKLYEVIQGVEGYIAFLAAQNFTDDMSAEAQEILQVMEAAKKTRDYSAFNAANNRFHFLIDSAANNPNLVEIGHLTREKMIRIHSRDLHIEGRLERSYEENTAIAQAMIKHDAEEAQRQQRSHLRSSRDYLIMLLDKLIIPYVGPEF